ncbi:hypothetical protein Ddc_09334 [Ditylenchus destructor]|nr:hypothetical protein Ddc_09334 [Ditylenchus destructor]
MCDSNGNQLQKVYYCSSVKSPINPQLLPVQLSSSGSEQRCIIGSTSAQSPPRKESKGELARSRVEMCSDQPSCVLLARMLYMSSSAETSPQIEWERSAKVVTHASLLEKCLLELKGNKRDNLEIFPAFERLGEMVDFLGGYVLHNYPRLSLP